jgi:DNA polymerase III alpha subunit
MSEKIVTRPIDMIECIYRGIPLDKIHLSDEMRDGYNRGAIHYDMDLLPDCPTFTGEYLMPDHYKTINLVEYFDAKTSTEIEKTRVAEELYLFYEAKADNMLRYMIYLGDVLNTNNIITGVGRGSSVSLYTLYLCGVHMIDSIKYNLDYYDFFKRIAQ